MWTVVEEGPRKGRRLAGKKGRASKRARASSGNVSRMPWMMMMMMMMMQD